METLTEGHGILTSALTACAGDSRRFLLCV